VRSSFHSRALESDDEDAGQAVQRGLDDAVVAAGLDRPMRGGGEELLGSDAEQPQFVQAIEERQWSWLVGARFEASDCVSADPERAGEAAR
jgi:hypothetical protein